MNSEMTHVDVACPDIPELGLRIPAEIWKLSGKAERC
jgi:hypothetical protein